MHSINALHSTSRWAVARQAGGYPRVLLKCAVLASWERASTRHTEILFSAPGLYSSGCVVGTSARSSVSGAQALNC